MTQQATATRPAMTPDEVAVAEREVAEAFVEDLGGAVLDVTSALLDPELRARGVIVARRAGVVAGLEVARLAFSWHGQHALDVTGAGEMNARARRDALEFTPLVADGEQVAEGTRIAEVSGRAWVMLSAERIALNFLQRLSGIATLTRRYAAAVEVVGSRALVCDTRKTTPGMRALERYAVRCGGGTNHRFGLFDAVMLKDNHVALLGGVQRALATVRENTLEPGAPVIVEVGSLEQLQAAIDAGPPDIVLCDNMTVEQLRQAVAVAGGRVAIEASGGVTLDNVAAVAQTGVDRISIGALTHSAPALDIALDVE